MKKFEAPELEIEKFKTEDLITASASGDPADPTDPPVNDFDDSNTGMWS